mmetsp:Transcript_38194/g.107919  ORF Transcript_38194/g.107919 Transcript_38194/m.107919 type:complete len:257 (+) Transcript_38194:450-1220(+)
MHEHAGSEVAPVAPTHADHLAGVCQALLHQPLQAVHLVLYLRFPKPVADSRLEANPTVCRPAVVDLHDKPSLLAVELLPHAGGQAPAILHQLHVRPAIEADHRRVGAWPKVLRVRPEERCVEECAVPVAYVEYLRWLQHLCTAQLVLRQLPAEPCDDLAGGQAMQRHRLGGLQGAVDVQEVAPGNVDQAGVHARVLCDAAGWAGPSGSVAKQRGREEMLLGGVVLQGGSEVHHRAGALGGDTLEAEDHIVAGRDGV